MRRCDPGSVGAGTASYLSDHIYRFRKQHPLVSLQIYSATADDIKERIEQGLLDIGLLMEPVDISRYDFLRMEKKERWGILTAKDSPLFEKETVTVEDLDLLLCCPYIFGLFKKYK